MVGRIANPDARVLRILSPRSRRRSEPAGTDSGIDAARRPRIHLLRRDDFVAGRDRSRSAEGASPECAEPDLTAIEGHVAPGDVQTATALFTAPPGLSTEEPARLVEFARQALAAAQPKPTEFDPGTARERTFLQALAVLLQGSGGEARYIYNARRYRLSLRKSEDRKAAAAFREKGLIASNVRVLRAEGKLCREIGGKEHTFQLWVEDGAARPLPLRIEYQPKSYLRLIFEIESRPV